MAMNVEMCLCFNQAYEYFQLVSLSRVKWIERYLFHTDAAHWMHSPVGSDAFEQIRKR